MSMQEDRLKTLLRKLFQFDDADLDFGIPRIMNMKRKEIDKFIDEGLIEAVEEALKEYSSENKESLEKEIEEMKAKIINEIAADAILPDGSTNLEKYSSIKLVEEYEEKRKKLKTADIKEDEKARIFNHIHEFFSRYYDNGDFISKGRFSRENKYCVPYNGEEVLLHWATKDQYYIKTGESFNNYTFDAGDWKVNFRIKHAETDVNNTKSGENRYFVLAEDPFETDDEKKEFTVYFEYRGISDEEKKELGASQNKKIKEKLNERTAESIMEHVDGGLKHALNRVLDTGSTVLEKHVKKYTTKNTTDYFIHKNLKSFLEKELDFYAKNEFFDLDDIENKNMSEEDIKRIMASLRAFKRISKKIIDFLAQIEELQKKLWEKKKFVVRADYCVTLDRIPEGFYDEILKNEAQIEEWKRLYNLEELEKGTLSWDSQNNTVKFDTDYLKTHPYMMLDTKFFDDDFKYRILSTFDDIDEQTDGLLIKSENWQALKLLQEKYKERIKTIYIDPPYNTKKDREEGRFIYKDGYSRSSWLSLVYDRIRLAKPFLNDLGIFFCSIDDNENYRMREVLHVLFGDENYLYELVWNLGTGTQAGHFTRMHEYIEAFAKNKSNLPNFSNEKGGIIAHGALKKISKANPPSEITFPAGIDFEGEDAVFEGVLGGSEKEIIKSGKMIFKNGKLAEPVTIEAGWAMRNQILSWLKGEETYDTKGQKVIRFYFNSQGILWYEKEKSRENPPTILTKIGTTKEGSTELKNIIGILPFPFPKPSNLIRYLLRLSANHSNTILDFFAGSGTTGHAVINLNREDGGHRKYILVEMGEYFDTVLKPRIQKVVFSADWKDGVPQNTDTGVSHMFKYMYLEQYEDTLNNIVFTLPDGTVQRTLFDKEGYFLNYMLDFESRESPCRLNIDMLERPFEYEMKIMENGVIKKKKIDLVETFNYLIGLDVEKYYATEDGERKYIVVWGTDRNGNKTVVIWRNSDDIDPKKDMDFVEKEIIGDKEPDRIYMNGKFMVPSARIIEKEFKTRMGV